MRDFRLEDELFLKLSKEVRSSLLYKLSWVGKSHKKNYTELVDDLIHDAFILIRKELERKNFVLNSTISEKELRGYMVTIIYSRYYNLMSGHKPNYFEDIPNRDMQSLDEFLEYWGDSEEFIGTLAPDFSCSIEPTIDVERIHHFVENHVNPRLKPRERRIYQTMLEGGNGKYVIQKNGFKEPKNIANAVKTIRKSILEFLGSEFDDFREGSYTITNGNTLKSLAR